MPGTQRSRPWRLIGVLGALAAATWLLWRRGRSSATTATPHVRRPSRPTRAALIVNRWSGDGEADRLGLVEAAEAAGIRVIPIERGDDLSRLARAAVADGADALGAAGGDGSLGLIAAVAIEADVPFFCVPVGTKNHFALDLGLDRDDPLAALSAVRDGEEIAIDHGLAGERVFVNNISLGLYATALHRGGYAGTITEVLRSAGTDDAAIAPIRFATPEGDVAEAAAVTIVSNNPYVFSGPPDYGRRLRLDQGTLGIATIAQGAGSADATGAPRSWEAERVQLECDEPILAAIDGEPVTFGPRLEVEIRPRGLRVLVPAGTEPGYVPAMEAIAAQLVDLAALVGVPGLRGPDSSPG